MSREINFKQNDFDLGYFKRRLAAIKPANATKALVLDIDETLATFSQYHVNSIARRRAQYVYFSDYVPHVNETHSALSEHGASGLCDEPLENDYHGKYLDYRHYYILNPGFWKSCLQQAIQCGFRIAFVTGASYRAAHMQLLFQH